MPMQNIVALLNNLRESHWHITAFPFTYNQTDYIDKSNENHILQTRANQRSFQISAREFRTFFGIQYAPNLGDIFKQFYNYFGTFIPTTRIQTFDNQTQTAMVNKLSRNDNENVNNIFCYATRHNGCRNGVQCHRTPFNSDKTKLLREGLFNMLGNDDTISFCYREADALSDIEIYTQFTKNESLHSK